MERSDLKSRFLKFAARCLLIIPVTGILAFSVMKMKWTKEVYEKIESQLHKEKLKTFCFSAKEYQKINWIDKREFVLDGRWYDVIDKIQLKDGSHLLTVFCDDVEKEWISQFFKSKQDSHSPKSKKSFQQIFKNSLYQELCIELRIYPTCKNKYCYLNELLPQKHGSKFYPPPRFV